MCNSSNLHTIKRRAESKQSERRPQQQCCAAPVCVLRPAPQAPTPQSTHPVPEPRARHIWLMKNRRPRQEPSISCRFNVSQLRSLISSLAVTNTHANTSTSTSTLLAFALPDQERAGSGPGTASPEPLQHEPTAGEEQEVVGSERQPVPHRERTASIIPCRV